MKHLTRTLGVVGAVLLAAGTSLLASPAVQSFAVHHPAVAVYVPLVAAVLAALGAAVKDRGAGP